MRVVLGALLLASGSIGACVDGTTPDCSYVDSGCYPTEASSPTDGSSQSDVSDASSDVSPDVSPDALTD
jgi:hypothetical protein